MNQVLNNNLEETANNSQSLPPTLNGVKQFDVVRSYLDQKFIEQKKEF